MHCQQCSGTLHCKYSFQCAGYGFVCRECIVLGLGMRLHPVYRYEPTHFLPEVTERLEPHESTPNVSRVVLSHAYPMAVHSEAPMAS